jgi:hypothetical protein
MFACFLLVLVGVTSPFGVYSDKYQPLDTYLHNPINLIHYERPLPLAVSKSICSSSLGVKGASCGEVINVNVPSVKQK